MNDPHVELLEYRLVDPAHLFKDPPPLEHEAQDFKVRLDSGRLIVTMKAHYLTDTEARRAVEPFLKAWELDYALHRGRREVRFEFENGRVIDRKPPQKGETILLAGGATFKVTGVAATLTGSRCRSTQRLLLTSPSPQMLRRCGTAMRGIFLVASHCLQWGTSA